MTGRARSIFGPISTDALDFLEDIKELEFTLGHLSDHKSQIHLQRGIATYNTIRLLVMITLS